MKVRGTLCVVLLLGYLASRNEKIRAWIDDHGTSVRWVQAAAVLVLLLTSVGSTLVMAHREHLWWRDDATVLQIAAAYHNGQAMYPAVGSPAEYGLLYGPATYLVYLPPMFLGAERLSTYLTWLLVPLIGLYGLVYTTVRATVTREEALALTGLVAAYVCRFRDHDLAIKGDLWILLFAALAFWAARRAKLQSAWLIAGVACGFLVDLKITLLPFTMLPWVELWRRGLDSRGVWKGMLVFLAVLVLPFCLPGISLAAYLNQLHQASEHGLDAPSILKKLGFLFVFVLPTLALIWRGSRVNVLSLSETLHAERGKLMLLGFVAATLVVTGAKRGAGPWHLLPLIVPLMLFNALLWRVEATQETPRRLILNAGLVVAGVFGLFMFRAEEAFFTFPFLSYVPSAPIVQDWIPDVEDDARHLLQAHAGQPVGMGYSDLQHWNLADVRPLLPLRGNRVLIDGVSRGEAGLAGRPVPPAVLNALAQCDLPVWLIPRGGEPFSFGASEAIQAVFLEHYTKNAEQPGRYFDVWTCKEPV